VREQLRDLLRGDRIKDSVRTRLTAVVTDAMGPQQRRIDELHHELNQLRDELRRMVPHEVNRTLHRVDDLEERLRRDIVFAADRASASSSAEYAAEHMPTALLLPHPHQTLEHGLSLAPTGGMALEFGVYSGTTLKIIAAARPDSPVFGFDSFEGLPEDWRSGFPAGTFQVDGLPEVPGAELVVGLFDDTLPGFLEKNQGPVDLLHVDCDLYSSTVTVLTHVGPRLRAGSVVVFDEFFNFRGWQDHEAKAWQEYVDRTGTTFTFEAYTHDNEQVVVRITGV